MYLIDKDKFDAPKEHVKKINQRTQIKSKSLIRY